MVAQFSTGILAHFSISIYTDKEVEALCSLSDARGALMRIAAAVKSIQGSHRAQYFADTRIVEQWMRAAIPLMARWNEIQEYITQ